MTKAFYPYETTNLIDEYPELAKRLSDEMDRIRVNENSKQGLLKKSKSI